MPGTTSRSLWRLPAVLALAVAASLALASCGDREPFGSGTGGITAEVIWQSKPSSKKIKAPKYQSTVVEGVETVRATVSGSDFAPLTKDTPFEAGGDEIGGVPVGVNRALTLQGLDADGAILYEGTVSGITVTGGETANAGTIVMEPRFAGFSITPSSLALSEGGVSRTLSIRPYIAPAGGTAIELDVSIADSTEALVDTAMPLTWNDTDFASTRTVQISPVDEDESDGNQGISIAFDAGTSTDPDYAALVIAAIPLTVSDDDTPGLTLTGSPAATSEDGTTDGFSVVLNSNPGAGNSVTITITSQDLTEGTVSPSSLTFDGTNWDTPQNVLITPVDDNLDDGNQTYNVTVDPSSLTHSGYDALTTQTVSVTNSDDDTDGFTISSATVSTSEGGTAQTFTIRPNTDPDGDTVTMDITSMDTTEGTVSPATLSWTTVDWNTAKTVTVTPVNDNIDDGSLVYDIELDPSSSTEAGYAALAIETVAVTNGDDDTDGFTITPTTLSTSEGGTAQTFTIRPNTDPDGSTIVVTISSTDTTEGTVSPASLDWTTSDWTTAKTVTVTPVQESLADGNQVFEARLNPVTSTHTGYAALGIQAVSVTNSDDDTPGFTITPVSLSTSEGGTAQSFTIRPNTDPGGNTVEVDITSSDTTEGTITSTTPLTWTTSDWTTAKTVTVTPVNDDEDDGNQGFNVQLSPANSTAVGYSGLGTQTVSVTNSDDDASAFTITPTSLSTSEGGSAQTFTIRPNTNPGADTVTVAISSMDTTEGTVSPASLSWTSADWTTAKTVTVTPVNDAVIDGNPQYDVRLNPATSTAATYAALGIQVVQVTNSDNDTAGFTISPTSLNTSEGGAAQTFTIRPNTDPDTGTVEVDIASANTAEGTVSPATLTWTTADYTTAKTVTVTPVNEAVDDGNQTYNVQLNPVDSTATGYGALAVQTVSVTNSDDDTAGFTITPTTLSTSEGGTAKTFTIRPNTDPGTGNTVEVDIGSTDTTEGTVSPALLTWSTADYTTAKTVTVTPVNDPGVDGAQAYDIELDPLNSTALNYPGLPIQIVDVSNADNDVAGAAVTPTSGLLTTEDGDTATFSVVLNTLPNGNVVVLVESLDTTEVHVNGPAGTPGATATLTFTTADWSTAQTVTVTGLDDGSTDGNQTVTVRLTVDTVATTDTTGYDSVNPADVQASNLDNESPGVTVTPTSGLATSEAGLSDAFSVVLNTLPTGNVVINVTSLDTTEVTVDKAALTFTTANWSTPQVVTATGVNDVTIDGNVLATIQLTMDTASTADASYDLIEPDDVTATNSDNDSAGVTVTPASGLITSEDGLFATFTVVLNTLPDGDVVIDLAESDVSEISLDKYTLTFTASDWSTPQTVTVYGEDDLLEDGSQNVTVQLTTDTVNTLDTTGYDSVNPPDAAVVNVDDDAVGITVTPNTTLLTTEGGGSAAFTVLLNTLPDGDVVIDVTPADGTEVSVNKSTLTFTTSDWATPQTVIVTGQDDALTDGNQSTTVDLDVDAVGTTDTTGYDTLTRISVDVINADNDVPGVTVLPTSGLVTTEGGATATFSVVLNKAPNNNVVILLFNETTAEIGVDKTSLTFTTSDWQTPQYVTLTGLPDGSADGTQVTGVTLTMDTLLTTDTTGYDSLNPADVAGINLDNNAGVTVNPTSGLVTTEAGGVDTFSVVLNTQPTGTVVINVSSPDTSEVTVDKPVLTFTADDWATAQVVTLTGVDDLIADGTQPVTISVTTNGGLTTDATYALINPPDVSVTNVDNDSGGFTVTPTSGLVTTESGTSDTFSVRLNLPPDGDVVINVTSGDTGEVSTSVSSLTFTTSDWSTPQVVTVTGVNDSTADGDIAVTVALAVDTVLTTDTTGYDSLDPDDVSVTNQDNESAGEGTIATPVNLTGTLPAEGSVGAGSSFYVVSGLTAGSSYMVTTTSVSADLELYIYSDSGYTTEICPTTNNAFNDERPESCVVTAPAGGTLYIEVRVDATFSPGGGTFDVNVFPAPVANEGASGAPLVLNYATQLPYQGRGLSLDNAASKGYYSVSGLAPSTVYRVQITNLTANVDLRVFSDINYTTQLCQAQVSSIAEACEATSTASGELFIMTYRNTTPAPALSQVAYDIDVLPQLSDEGTVTPVDLTGQMPYEGMIKTTRSRYTVTGLVPSASYRVELINMAGQGALRVYTDSTYATAACTSDRAGNFPEFCTVTSNGSGQLFFAGIPGGGFSSAGATYTVQVK